MIRPLTQTLYNQPALTLRLKSRRNVLGLLTHGHELDIQRDHRAGEG
jgi:hypothetical protein